MPRPNTGTGEIIFQSENYNIALPGYYMLFVVLDKTQSTSEESNIPSEAVFVKLSLP